MKQLIALSILLFAGVSVNAQKDACCTKDKETTLKCKLTSQELRERKATVIASLKDLLIKKKELKDGYAFKFSGADEVVAQINEFIKTESECCDFFVFDLSVKENKSEAWLHITGPKGVKDFIKTEIGM